MATIALLNPNTNAATTAAMVEIAAATAPHGVSIRGVTAGFGADLITTPAALAVAADAVLAAAGAFSEDAAVIVAAFGDPGRDRLAAALDIPVVGIAEAAMAEAAALSRGRFAIATTTPDLADAIRARAAAYGHGQALVAVRTPAGDAAALMADPAAVEAVLEDLCRQAIEEDGARAVVIGGGPLARAARALAHRFAVPIVEPIPAAARMVCARLGVA